MTDIMFTSHTPVSGHEDFDIAPGVKPVQLVDELKHGTLDFIGTSISITETCTLGLEVVGGGEEMEERERRAGWQEGRRKVGERARKERKRGRVVKYQQLTVCA